MDLGGTAYVNGILRDMRHVSMDGGAYSSMNTLMDTMPEGV